jgi:peroxiredoxin
MEENVPCRIGPLPQEKKTMQEQKRNLFRSGLLFLVGVWLLFGIGILVWSLREQASAVRMLAVNESAPLFELPDQDGRTHKLRDYQNRAVALAFLPDLGETSRDELRSLDRAMRQFDTIGVKVFGIVAAEAAAAKRLHDSEGLDFPILLDKGNRVARKYGAGAPNNPERRLSYVIGPESKVLLPVQTVHASDHGRQLVELAECCLDTKPIPGSKFIGKPIADFSLPRVSDGKPETLYGDKKQKATVLFVLSAQCPCSAKYNGRCAELARRYGAQGIRFLAMNSSDGETPQEIAAQAQQAGFPFPVVKDAGNVIADKIEARVTPEVFVMDSKGVLRYHGRIDDHRNPKMVLTHDLRNALDFLLAGKLPPYPERPMFGCAIARARAN